MSKPEEGGEPTPNSELDVTLLREDERELYESIKHDYRSFAGYVRVLLRRLIEERGGRRDLEQELSDMRSEAGAMSWKDATGE